MNQKEEKGMEQQRREFLSTVSRGTACLLCSGALFLSCEDPSEPEGESSVPLTPGEPVIDLTAETSLQNPGGSVKKRFSAVNGGKTIIIFRVLSSSFTAFAAQCTHQGTEIGLPTNAVMICPNHGSKFNANSGAVIQGPAAAPLTKFSALFDSEKNTVTIISLPA